jgi:hypothetical protein
MSLLIPGEDIVGPRVRILLPPAASQVRTRPYSRCQDRSAPSAPIGTPPKPEFAWGNQAFELAEPGGICVSRFVRDQVRDRLDYTFEDLGEQQVKNGVLGHLAPVKAGHHLAPVDPFKSKQIGATPCLHRAPR